MDITQALDDLGVGNDSLTEEAKNELDERGYAVLPGLIDDKWLAALRERFEDICDQEGVAAGIEVTQEAGARRLSDLVNKGEVFDRVYTNPTVLAAIHHVIGRDFKLSSLNARDALPGEGHQKLHPDWFTDDNSKDYDGRFHVCNSIWLLDDFTEDNGCTRFVPGTHLGQHPDMWQALRTPLGQHPDSVVMAAHPKEEHLVASAGSVAVFNSHIWHGGTLNRTKDSKRRALHCYFTAREHEQQLNQREYIRYETWKRISRAARHILDVDLG